MEPARFYRAFAFISIKYFEKHMFKHKRFSIFVASFL
jgi:hypothetical protein